MNKRSVKIEEVSAPKQGPPVEAQVINQPPFIGWPNFDVFLSQVLKGRLSATTKSACQAHFKALGIWDDQSKWIDGLIDFGIPIEKE